MCFLGHQHLLSDVPTDAATETASALTHPASEMITTPRHSIALPSHEDLERLEDNPSSVLTIRQSPTQPRSDPLANLPSIPSEVPATPSDSPDSSSVQKSSGSSPVAEDAPESDDPFSPPLLPASIPGKYPSRLRATDLLTRVKQRAEAGPAAAVLTHRFTLVKPPASPKVPAPVSGLIGWGNWFSLSSSSSASGGLGGGKEKDQGMQRCGVCNNVRVSFGRDSRTRLDSDCLFGVEGVVESQIVQAVPLLR